MLTCRQSSTLGHLTLFASSLLLCTHSLWAQKSSPPEEIQARSFDHSRQLARIPDARAHLRAMPGKLPDAPESQTKAHAGRLALRIRYHYTLVAPQATTNFQQPIGAAELQSETKSFTRSALSHWRTPANGMVRYPTIHPAKLQFYDHYIPWADPIISRVAQQAEAHPHVTSVLKLFQPQF